MLNLISTVKVKAAVSLLVLAAALALSLMNSVQAVLVDVLPMVEEVEAAAVIPSWTAADSSDLLKIMTVKTQMVRIMQDSPVYKFSEEELAVNASLVTLTLEFPVMAELLSVSSTIALEVDLPLNWKFKLEQIRYFAQVKERRPFLDTSGQSIALIHNFSVKVLERNTAPETVWEEVAALTTFANATQATKE